MRRKWLPFCLRTECSCFVPDEFICEEFQEAEHWRCGYCGWPKSIHMVRDRMAEAGLKFTVSAERIQK